MKKLRGARCKDRLQDARCKMQGARCKVQVKNKDTRYKESCKVQGVR